ncbi:hypothetical protein Ssi03_76220 [Sphaerisporangium siamense]|uniref:Uncharacterized protein n=1 Tax=Sphaerisporangium siamense TaxID=795645 RepID=A0A7W7D2X9_9ACTN|nr:hypothetical protein [Sphaerisporangium siamense]MBB4699302.1 hypothetical protein [Sphaerisporangium siamense]GII89632.1 hypothetical protein Ssi03_76220 [Sphaerisporangium siamense]
MGLRPVFGDAVLPSAARGAGTYTSGPAANAGLAADVLLMVHVSAASGSPTLNCSLEESADGTSWTAVPGSSTAQLTAAGNALAGATITKNYVRVTSTVAGTTPSVTYRAVLLVVPE